MLIARKKTKWVLYFPSSLPVLLALTLPLSLPWVHATDRHRPLVWVIRCALIGGLAVSARFARRRSDHVIVRELLDTKSLWVTPATRISAKYECSPHAARPQPNYVFRIVGSDGAVADLGKAWWTSGTTPADMGRRLASVLNVPLDDDAPGAGGEQPDNPGMQVETKAKGKGLEDSVTGWIHRHWLLSISAGLAVFLVYLYQTGGVQSSSHAQIEMPCAGHGYHTRLHFGSFTRIDGNVSGDVNPGNNEISVWDESRRCWARRIVSVDLGHRMRVDCAWVLASSDCVSSGP